MSKFSAKVASVVLTVATSVTMMGSGTLVSVAGAQTLTELMAQLAALQAQIAALQGAPSPACPALTRDLSMGASGSDVASLQAYMIAHGFGISAGATGYFGAQTFAAVKAWQASNGVPSTGYFGPMSRAKLAALCVVTPTPTPTPTPSSACNLSGGAGSVNDYTLVSGLNNEEVGEDAEDVKVAGLEIEADESSDLQITAVRLVFTDEGAANNDDDLDEYADEVSIWMGSKELARVDADTFNDDNDYSRTITLGGCAIVKAEDSENLYVAISGISNLDDASAGDSWDVDFDEVRVKDASGTTITEDPGTTERVFTFESFATAEDVELKLREASDNPEEQVVEVDDANDTEDVVLVKGTLKAEGSDIEVKEMTVDITSAGDDPDKVATDFSLWIDGEEVQTLDSSECDDANDCDGDTSVDTAATYLFDDVDTTIDEGDTVDIEVRATVAGTDDSAEGVSLSADLDNSATEAEDETGEDLDAGAKTGALAGETQTFYSVAPMFDLVSATGVKTAGSAGVSSTPDTGTYTIKYKITAFGDDITIDMDCEENNADAPDQGVEFTVDGNTYVDCDVDSTADVNPDDANAWIVREGDSETITLTVVTEGADAIGKVYLNSINWDNPTTDTDPDQYFTAGLGESDTSTNSLFLDDNA